MTEQWDDSMWVVKAILNWPKDHEFILGVFPTEEMANIYLAAQPASIGKESSNSAYRTDQEDVRKSFVTVEINYTIHKTQIMPVPCSWIPDAQYYSIYDLSSGMYERYSKKEASL